MNNWQDDTDIKGWTISRVWLPEGKIKETEFFRVLFFFEFKYHSLTFKRLSVIWTKSKKGTEGYIVKKPGQNTVIRSTGSNKRNWDSIDVPITLWYSVIMELAHKNPLDLSPSEFIDKLHRKNHSYMFRDDGKQRNLKEIAF